MTPRQQRIHWILNHAANAIVIILVVAAIWILLGSTV